MRSSCIRGAAIAALLLAATPSLAHINLGQREAPVGSSYRAVLLVGHGCDGAATTEVRVQIPEGFYNAQPMAKVGWEITTTKGTYATPFMNHGEELTEGVTEIVWSGNSLPDGLFDEFAFRGSFGADLEPGAFYFPTVQSCGRAEETWIDTTGAEDAEMPAPALTLVEGTGHGH
jgi:uncharacterized protein YcnI